MNIWIEGVDGTGKTTLAAALGEALGVEPLYHVTHDDLPEGQRYNVIDRHAAITNEVYKRALPERFRGCPDVNTVVSMSNDDLLVHLERTRFSGVVDDYTDAELDAVREAYSSYYFEHDITPRLVVVGCDPALGGLHLVSCATAPDCALSKIITIGTWSLLEDHEKSLRVKVREILNIIAELEHQRVANK